CCQCFFVQAEDGIRDFHVTGVQTCALPISRRGERAMSEKTYEMFWDCEYCGAAKLLGLTQRYCPNCGAPQNPEKRYFPPEHEKRSEERRVGKECSSRRSSER